MCSYDLGQEEVTGRTPTCDDGNKLALFQGSWQHPAFFSRCLDPMWCISWKWPKHVALALLLDNTLLLVPEPKTSNSLFRLDMAEPVLETLLLSCSLSLQGCATPLGKDSEPLRLSQKPRPPPPSQGSCSLQNCEKIHVCCLSPLCVTCPDSQNRISATRKDVTAGGRLTGCRDALMLVSVGPHA